MREVEAHIEPLRRVADCDNAVPYQEAALAVQRDDLADGVFDLSFADLPSGIDLVFNELHLPDLKAEHREKVIQHGACLDAGHIGFVDLF